MGTYTSITREMKEVLKHNPGKETRYRWAKAWQTQEVAVAIKARKKVSQQHQQANKAKKNQERVDQTWTTYLKWENFTRIKRSSPQASQCFWQHVKPCDPNVKCDSGRGRERESWQSYRWVSMQGYALRTTCMFWHSAESWKNWQRTHWLIAFLNISKAYDCVHRPTL